MRRKRTRPGPGSMPTAGRSRRDFLWRFGGGLGGVAMAHLLGTGGLLAGATTGPTATANLNAPHRPAKARRVIQLFMNGGVSQMDTFLRRPKLDELPATARPTSWAGGRSTRSTATTSTPPCSTCRVSTTSAHVALQRR